LVSAISMPPAASVKNVLTAAKTHVLARVSYGDCIGSLASYTVWRESYLLKISSSIKNKHAAAILCGGTAIFNILTNYNVKPSDRVGTVGVGGLGQLAIQFTAKTRCETVVFSQTEKNEGVRDRVGGS